MKGQKPENSEGCYHPPSPPHTHTHSTSHTCPQVRLVVKADVQGSVEAVVTALGAMGVAGVSAKVWTTDGG